MFFIKNLKFLNLFNSKKVLQTIVNRFDDDSMVAKAIDCKAEVLTDVSNNCLKMQFKVNSKIEGKDMNIVFAFNFVLPPNKTFNPQEVAKRVNNLTNVFVKEFKIGNNSYIKEFGLRERSVTSNFAQRVLSRYILENKGVYQHALEALCNCGVKHDICTCDTVGGTQGTELKLISCKREGRCTVPVGCISGEPGQCMNTQLHGHLLDACIGLVIPDSIEDSCKLLTQEYGNDGRRCLVGSQTVIVSCSCNRQTEQILIIIHCLDHCTKEQQELCIFIRSLTGRQKVNPCIRSDGPVVVFTGTVHSGKGLLMKETYHTVTLSHLLHDLHGQLIVVCSDIG